MPAKPSTSPTPDQRAPRPGSVRAFAGAPTSVDEATRSFEIIITTEHPVRRCLPDPRQPVPIPDNVDASYIEVDEVLIAAGVDLSRTPRMPLIDCHDTYSGIEKILGKIDDVRVEGDAVVGRASHASMPICCRTSSTDTSARSVPATTTTCAATVRSLSATATCLCCSSSAGY